MDERERIQLDKNRTHLEMCRPFVAEARDGTRYNVAAPTFYCAAWTAQQELGDDNINIMWRYQDQ